MLQIVVDCFFDPPVTRVAILAGVAMNHFAIPVKVAPELERCKTDGSGACLSVTLFDEQSSIGSTAHYLKASY